MLRSGRSRDWNYCLAIVHEADGHVTNAIVHGLEEEEIEIFKNYLRRCLDFAHYPWLVAVILVELKLHHFAKLLERRAQSLDDIEFETGMRHGFSNRQDRDTGNSPRSEAERLRSREELDFDLLTQKLTGLAGTFAFCDLTFQNGCKSLEVIQKAANNLQGGGMKLEMPESLCRRIEYLKALIVGAQNTRTLLEQRTQAQIQTVGQPRYHRLRETSL